ncbi:Uncharacterized protein TCM_008436 [Theobroma cacao]|uniref:Uncharacterized protein n=1 Tax=Theobroma cacao TaxID=3641 RepID=A0A061E5U7_THECC|nr:Uncharacterized protein TCM_008436 [Theobroma cacao]
MLFLGINGGNENDHRMQYIIMLSLFGTHQSSVGLLDPRRESVVSTFLLVFQFLELLPGRRQVILGYKTKTPDFISEGRQSRTKSLKQYLISGQVGFPLINGKPNEVTPLPSFSSSSFPFIISLFQFQHQPNPRPNLH